MSKRLWGIKKYDISRAPMGLEPMTSCLQDRRSNQLSYGALHMGEADAWNERTSEHVIRQYVIALFTYKHGANLSLFWLNCAIKVGQGELAQKIECPLSMREVPGSMLRL